MTDPDGMQGGAAELLAVGMVGNADQLACARESVTGLDRGQPQRAIDLQVTGGLSLRLLPDRGLDVGAAWFDGIPLAWISRVGEVSPAPGGRAPWIDRFGGGLVTTCGLQNVGVASEGHGQHGAFSTTPASDLRTDRAAVDGELELVVTGVVREGDALDSFLECRRRVTTRTGRAAMTLTDTVVNLGTRSVPSPMLYHLNIGAPLWSPGARVVVPRGARTVPRDAGAKAFEDSWDTAPQPVRDGVERVFEHVIDAAGPAGRQEIRVVHEALGVAVTVAWDARTMPRVHQWVHPRAGVYVLGLEPANCSVLGRAADRAAGRLPTLEPGESRTTSLSVTAARLR